MNRARLLTASLPAVLAVWGCTPKSQPLVVAVERGHFHSNVAVEGVLRSAKRTAVAAPSQLNRPARISWLAEDGARVAKGDVIARFDQTEMSQRLSEGQADLNEVGHRIDGADAKAKGRALELEATRETAMLEAAVAERFTKDDEGVFSRVEVIESRIDGELAGKRQEHAENMSRVEEQLAHSEGALLSIERRKVESEVSHARDALDALLVRAPEDGIVVLVRDWRGETIKIGDQVWRGQPIAEIPDLSTLEAELFVLEADAGDLKEGLRTRVRLESRPGLTLGATIKSVEAVARPRHRGSPVQYVAALATFEDLTAQQQALLKPGMRVSAHIDLDEREDVLMVPRQAVERENDQAYVWVKSGGQTTRRAIETVAQSLGHFVVGSGLEEGERVLLVDPQTQGDGQVDADQNESSDGQDT